MDAGSEKPTPSLTVTTLGRLDIRWKGQPVPGLTLRKTQALLVYLAMNPRPHDRGRLAGLLWGDRPEEQARRNLRHALCELRRHLGPALLDGDRLSIGLSPDIPCQVDALIFQAEIERARSARRGRESEAAIGHLQAAVALYQGEFLAGFDLPGCPEFEEWATRRRAWLQERALEALAHLAAYCMQRGEYDRALDYARRQLALEPWWEEAHRQVMSLLALTGQRSAALAQYEECRRLLAEELGLEPLEETTALRDRIRSARPLPAPVLPGAPAPALPFVGRGREHSQLVAWWEAARQGQGQLALVEGEAGVGKTRLVEEVIRYAEAQGATVLRGRCYEFGGGVPYQPIAEALRSILNPRSLAIQHLLSNIQPVWLAELSRLLPELRELRPGLSPLQVSGEEARQRLFEAVARFLSSCLFLVFLDDLQWADPPSLDLLHYLVRHRQDRPGYAATWLVGTYRPEEVDLSHPLTRLRQGLGRDHLVHRLILEPLSPQAIEQIAYSLAGREEGAALGAFLYRECEGNPFVLAEIVADLYEQHRLQTDEEGRRRWAGSPERETAGSKAGGILPSSVQDMILQRVGRLPLPAQRLLALAAIIGRRFDLALLRAAAGPDTDAVDDSLEAWLEHRLVRAEAGGAPSSPASAIQYDLSHDKIRAAVYQATPPALRRSRHRQVGLALEALYAGRLEPLYEQLAYHYEQAGERDKAPVYLLLAASRAVAVYAYEEALTCYDRALAWLEAEDERRGAILVQRATALRSLGRYVEAILTCRQAFDGSQQAAQACLLAAQAASELSTIYQLQCDYDQARVWIQEAIRLADALPPEAKVDALEEQARSKQRLAAIEREQGNLEAARTLFEEAMELYRRLDNRRGTAECQRGLGCIFFDRGWYDAARQQVEEALLAFQALDDRQQEATCLGILGSIYWRQRANEAAHQAFARCLALCRAIGDRPGEAEALNGLGLVHIAQGEHVETRRCWEESVALYRSLGLEKQAAHGLHNLGILLMDQGDLATARRCLEESLAVHRSTGARSREALDLGWLGRLCLLSGEYKQARHCLETALTLRQESKGGVETPWQLAWLGAVACEMGDLVEAEDCFQKAARLAEQGGMGLGPFELSWLAAVQLAREQGQAALATARRMLAEAEAEARPAEIGWAWALLGSVHDSGLLAAAEDPRPYFERALALSDQGHPFSHGVILRRYGAYLLHTGNRDQAAACLEEAKAIFARLGAMGELDKVIRLLAGDDAFHRRS